MGKTEINIKMIFTVTRNFTSIITAQLVYKIFSFITVLLIARFLDASEFGQFSYALSFVWSFLFLSDLGLIELFVRDISKDNALIDKYINNIFTIKIFLSFISYLLIIFLGYFFSFGRNKFLIILILGGATILDSFMYFFRSFFHLKEDMTQESVLMVIESFLKIILLLLAIRIKLDVTKVILISCAMLAVSIINLMINLVMFKLSRKNISLTINFGFWRYLLRSGIPLAIIYVLSLINFRIDIIMLSLMKSDEIAGLYSINYKLIEQFLLIPLSCSWVFLPVFSRLTKSLDNLKIFFKYAVFFLFIVSVCILILCYIFGEKAINILYGRNFSGAGVYLNTIIWVIVPFFMKPLLEKLLFVLGKQLIISLIYITGVIFHILLNLIAIPKIGLNGALLSTIICEIFIVAACFFIVYKRLFMVRAWPEVRERIEKEDFLEELIY